MISVPALMMVLTGICATFSVSVAQAGGNPELQNTEQDILDGFRHCVFTVNAYSSIVPEQTEGNTEKAKWKRNVGTALPIDDMGHLITISCVLKDAEKVTVMTDTGESVPAKVVGSDSAGRISVLRIDPMYIKEVPHAGSIDAVEKGSFAYFFGAVPDMEIAVTRGWISMFRPDDGIFELLGPKTAGTSGTPILDGDSNVIGILAFNIDTDDIDPDLSKYAVIPYEYAYVLARYIINNDMMNVGWLGVAIDISSTGKGILVSKVIESSPATNAGIAPGDRIVSFHDTVVTSPRHFIDLLGGTAPRDVVNITLLRGGDQLGVTVTMGDNPGRWSE